MNKANECTCPSGDGSLVHPCPAHPAVEQACWDERKLSDLGNELHNLSCSIVHENEKLAEQIGGIARELWNWPQARAAMAQPSPAPDYFAHADKKLEALLNATALILESPGHDAAHYWAKCLREYDEAHAQVAQARHVPELDPLNLAPHAEAFNEAPAEALKPEQAEAERPEVVARVVHSNPVVLGQCGPLNANDELMTVAQHAASVARWAEMFNRVEQERDAALARVAELEQKSAGSWTVDTSCGRPILMYEGCSVIEDQTAYEVIRMIKWIGELERQEPVATVAKVPGEDWNSLDFHRDLQDMQPGTKFYAAPVAQAQQLHDLDKQCRDDVARALGLRPNQERGFAWSYLLASIKSCVKASEDSAQAQHSVPEGVTIERDVAGTIHIKVGDFDFIQLQYQRPYTDNASTWKLAERIASLL
ncbi:hypothetical protein ACUW0R_006742, partial [Pseudomonas aeruginosa]